MLAWTKQNTMQRAMRVEGMEKKLPALGGRLVCPVTYRYRESNLNCLPGLYPSAIHDHTITCDFIAKVKASISEH